MTQKTTLYEGIGIYTFSVINGIYV
ncbi:hypothetical protein XBKB1_3020001 [Xenorhabdus bovienii str. kraussei Becker Underwood]|uniref:Uncharacterized protein n=1 Tax=Xenorhabdus bovienii str. kraussei Becker Underwood TaxID=1398204 RepID=A0A077PY20_XENBV|nr:hypothetical protein XBKB1_3020001 [Xenorhabdus bovienii str. kraussei Becker Underwood]